MVSRLHSALLCPDPPHAALLQLRCSWPWWRSWLLRRPRTLEKRRWDVASSSVRQQDKTRINVLQIPKLCMVSQIRCCMLQLGRNCDTARPTSSIPSSILVRVIETASLALLIKWVYSCSVWCSKFLCGREGDRVAGHGGLGAKRAVRASVPWGTAYQKNTLAGSDDGKQKYMVPALHQGRNQGRASASAPVNRVYTWIDSRTIASTAVNTVDAPARHACTCC